MSASLHKVAEDVISEHLDELYRAAVRMCGGETSEAGELVQEAAIRAFEHFHELRDPRAARTWLLTILSRTHLDRLRASRQAVATDDGAAASDTDFEAWDRAPAELAAANTGLPPAMVVEAFDALPPDLRLVAWLVDGEGLRPREVAFMLDLPEPFLVARLFQARLKLRSSLAARASRAGRAGGR